MKSPPERPFIAWLPFYTLLQKEIRRFLRVASQTLVTPVITASLYLFIFGDNVEEVLGHRRYLAFYMLCGTAAALTHGAFHPDSTTPVVGASGAVAGVLGAYLIFFPAIRVKTLLFFGIFVHITALPAAVLLGIWALLQVLSAAGAATGKAAFIAWYAHAGGFAAGLVTAPLFRWLRAGGRS